MAGLIRNLTEIGWVRAPRFGAAVLPEQDERWEQIGVNVRVLGPGEAASVYHREGGQEDFLVLAGEGTLLIEGEERQLKQWDFVHCPAGTAHALVGGPLTVIAVGARPVTDLVYPADPLAQRYGVGVAEETGDRAVAYAGTGPLERIEYGGWLE
jgi:hypothetical protein